MKNFEAVILLSPEISSTVKKNCLNDFVKIINDNGGEILETEDWGLRDLSYKINNISKAFYNFYQISIAGEKLENIKKTLNQDENYIRHLFVKVDKHQELPTKLNNEKK